MEEKTTPRDWVLYYLEQAIEALKGGDPALATSFALAAVERLQAAAGTAENAMTE